MSTPNTDLALTEQSARGKAVSLAGPQADFDSAYRLAKNLAMAMIIPDALRGKPADVLVIVLYGQELGLAPMQAINTIDVVKGRPSLRANLWVALARKAGHKVRVIEETADSCTVQVERSDDLGHPTTVKYTIDQAKAAGLLANNVWKNHPAAMLYARAVSTACRRACPEVAMGFVDEFEMAAGEQARPTLAQIAAERADQPAAVAPPVAVEEDDAALLAEVAAIAAEQEQPLEAEVVADPVDVSGWPEVAEPGGAR
jgi:hypothetical protein